MKTLLNLEELNTKAGAFTYNLVHHKGVAIVFCLRSVSRLGDSGGGLHFNSRTK